MFEGTIENKAIQIMNISLPNGRANVKKWQYNSEFNLNFKGNGKYTKV
jgi:hypothetical protein